MKSLRKRKSVTRTVACDGAMGGETLTAAPFLTVDKGHGISRGDVTMVL